MIRRIIKIDENLCNGCGICADACHEAAIEIKDGKARLIRDDYCDGLGDCLPACPVDAISFEEREALEYNEVLVKERIAKMKVKSEISTAQNDSTPSMLQQWPVQLKLVHPKAEFLNGCNLLIAADCTAFTYGNFHNGFLKDRTVLIGCPKLDDTDYSEKLTEIIKNNDIHSVTILRMEVPCCGGIVYYTEQALKNSGKFIPSQVITISTEGEIISQNN